MVSIKFIPGQLTVCWCVAYMYVLTGNVNVPGDFSYPSMTIDDAFFTITVNLSFQNYDQLNCINHEHIWLLKILSTVRQGIFKGYDFL